MLIAKRLKQENIAEYLLYMWQVEDLIRANGFDIDNIDKNIISGFDQPGGVKDEMREWYKNLIDMMLREGIKESGHLIINRNTLADISDLHNRLLKMPYQTEYINAYYNTLPMIVELRAKSGDKQVSEIETCLSALYGFLLMRLQKKEVSGETQAAVSRIGSLVRMLSQKYNDDRNGKLEGDAYPPDNQ